MAEITDRWLAHQYTRDIALSLMDVFADKYTDDKNSPFDIQLASEHEQYTTAREKLTILHEHIGWLLKWTDIKIAESTPTAREPGSDGQNHD